MNKLAMMLLFVCSWGCAPADEPVEQDDAPSVPVSSTVVRFEVPGQRPAAWGELPFPNDLYLTEGRPGIPAGFPNPRTTEPLFARTHALLAARTGFCTTCNVTFPFDGGLDPDTLDGRVYFVDLDSGAEIPARHEWRADTEELAVRAARGYSLAPGRDYAAVVAQGVRGTDGEPIALPVTMPAEALERLAEVGLQPADLAAVTTFRTDDPARLLRAVRRAIDGAAAPAPAVDRVYAAEELDELLGVPVDGRAGRDVPAEGAPHEYGMRHATTDFVVAGRLRTSRFVSGQSTDVGTIELDATGRPLALSTHEVPFILIVPHGADLAKLPVMVVQHGFSADRTTGFTHADTAGAAGWAVLAIDAYQHGDRARSARDRAYAMRGDVEGPDGFGEPNRLDVVSRVFGFSGVPQELALAPEYALSAFVQFSADALSAIRFAREGDSRALALAAGRDELRFDPDRVVYLGNSMGAVIGLGVTAVEDRLAGAILNVMPGGIVDVFAESGEFRPLAERIFMPLLGVEERFDEVERSMVFHPTADLFRWALEPIDPLALARAPRIENVLIQLAGHDEVAPPAPSEEVAAAAGFTQVARYPGAMHGMAEVREQLSEYETLQPLMRRARPAVVENPIDAVHDEITAFLRAVPR